MKKRQSLNSPVTSSLIRGSESPLRISTQLQILKKITDGGCLAVAHRSQSTEPHSRQKQTLRSFERPKTQEENRFQTQRGAEKYMRTRRRPLLAVKEHDPENSTIKMAALIKNGHSALEKYRSTPKRSSWESVDFMEQVDLDKQSELDSPVHKSLATFFQRQIKKRPSKLGNFGRSQENVLMKAMVSGAFKKVQKVLEQTPVEALIDKPESRQGKEIFTQVLRRTKTHDKDVEDPSHNLTKSIVRHSSGIQNTDPGITGKDSQYVEQTVLQRSTQKSVLKQPTLKQRKSLIPDPVAPYRRPSRKRAQSLSSEDSERGVSALTYKRNSVVMDERRSIDLLEENNDIPKEELRLKMQGLEYLVRSVQLSYNQCVSEGSQIVDLGEGVTDKMITVKPMGSLTCKLNTDEHRGPILFQIEYHSANDCRILIDKSKEFDAIELPLWRFKNQHRFSLLPQRAYDPSKKSTYELKNGQHDMRYWQPKQIFVCFQSKAGTSLSLSVSYPNEKSSTCRSKKGLPVVVMPQAKEPIGGFFEARLEVRDKIKQLEKEKGGYSRIVHEVQELKRLRELRERGGHSPRNVVHDNRIMIHDYQVSKMANISYLSTRNKELRLETTERHQQLELERLKFRIFQNIKWGILKAKRLAAEQEAYDRIQLRRKCLLLISLTNIRSYIKNIYSKFKVKADYYDRKRRELRAVDLFGKLYRKNMERRVTNNQGRVLRKVKYAFNFLQGMYPVHAHKEQASSNLASFMELSANIYFTQTAIISYMRYVHSLQKRLRRFWVNMNWRRLSLQAYFDREFKIMRDYYESKWLKAAQEETSKRDPKDEKRLRLLQKAVDHELRDMICEEFFVNVCRRYSKLQYRIYMMSRHYERPKVEPALEQRRLELLKRRQEQSDYDSEEEHSEIKPSLTFAELSKFYPLIFSAQDSLVIKRQQRAICWYLKNCFGGTVSVGKAVGGESKKQKEEKKKAKKKKDEGEKPGEKQKPKKEKKSVFISQIMHFCGYGDDPCPDEDVPRFVIQRPMEPPVLRCVPDRETMQRLVQKYLVMLEKARDADGELIPFEPYGGRKKKKKK